MMSPLRAPQSPMSSGRWRDRPGRAVASSEPSDTPLLVLAVAILSTCFIAGGSSVQTGMGVMFAELLALPLLLYAGWRAWQLHRLGPARWAIAVAAAIVALPLLQLLPLPEWLWRMAPARVALWDDLAAAGVTDINLRWSLTPAATEQNLYLLLPPVALFFAALASGRDTWHRMLWWVLGLTLFTLVLAFAQIGVAQDSFLNPFPQFEPTLSGVFANKNHQASALAIGLVLALALLLDARSRLDDHAGSRATLVLCAILAVVFVAVLPLVKSRAGVIIAFVVSGIVLLHSGPLSFSHWRAGGPVTRVVASLAALALLVGIWAAFAWMQIEADVDGSRWEMFTTTLRLGFANAPFGSGFGSFVPMFEQATQGSLMRTGYINNAHNDYVQWWFEGGVLAVLVLLAALSVLLIAVRRLSRLPERSRARTSGIAAGSALLVLLLHSSVDYPLRTPALMALAGLLAGIMVAAATRARPTP